MKQIFLKKSRLMFAIAVSLLLASCIDGYKDDWTFSSGVTNTTLLSPDSSKVVFSKDVKGNLVVTWPVIYGAGGYQFSLYIVDDPEHPVAVGTENEVINGCSATRALQEDTKYKAVIKTLGNTQFNNKDAEKVATAQYSTLLPAYAVIPDGTDLYEYFTANPIPDSTKELAYEMVANGKYTLSGPVDFQKHWITLRGDKVFHPTITYGVSGRLRTTAGFSLKYADIDCNAIGANVTDGAMLLLSATPDPAILNTAFNSYYIIPKDIFLYKCNITGINRRLIFDANIKYCLTSLIISDCTVALNALNDANGGIIYMQGGFINNFTVKNSTVYGNTATAGYFLRYNNSGRPDRAGFVSGSINFFNNTFYNVVYSGQMGNYSGMNSVLVKLNLSQNIFVNCGSNAVVRRLSVSTTTMVRTLSNNCYWYNGVYPEINEVTPVYGDKSGTAFGVDPEFANPLTGDFTIGANVSDIISKRSGDPRWLPAVQ
ncbi:MAG: DUF4992 family lipoprotein [Paludibacter sp.]